MPSPPPPGGRSPAARTATTPPRILRRTQAPQPSAASLPPSPKPRDRPSSWESFFLDSPPPPPAQGQPTSDDVNLVLETPDPRGASTDPVPTYSEVLLRRPSTPPHRPHFSPPLVRRQPAGKRIESSGTPRTGELFEWIRRTELRARRNNSPVRPRQCQRASPPPRSGRTANPP
jgi:hypothetical protein